VLLLLCDSEQKFEQAAFFRASNALNIYICLHMMQMVDAFMAVRPLPGMFD
jgi:hypothetical protein